MVPAGRIERVKATNAKRALTKKHGAQREKFASRIEDTMLKATITPFNGSYKESEHQKAMAMLVDASEKWNFRQGALTAFEGEHMLTHREILEFTNCITMTPTMFKEQLRRNFHIKLSAGQLAALIKHFDSGNADGTISCHKFQNEFIRMGNFSSSVLRKSLSFLRHVRLAGNRERLKLLKVKQDQVKVISAKQQALSQRINSQLEHTLLARTTSNFTSADLDRAMSKISTKSAFYDPAANSAFFQTYSHQHPALTVCLVQNHLPHSTGRTSMRQG